MVNQEIYRQQLGNRTTARSPLETKREGAVRRPIAEVDIKLKRSCKIRASVNKWQ